MVDEGFSIILGSRSYSVSIFMAGHHHRHHTEPTDLEGVLHIFLSFFISNLDLHSPLLSFVIFLHHVHYLYFYFLSFQKVLETTLSVRQPFYDRSPPRGYKHFVHFQEKFIEKFQAGESGIVLKPLNARLSTCILKNEQKKKNKKKRKNKTVRGIQDCCFL